MPVNNSTAHGIQNQVTGGISISVYTSTDTLTKTISLKDGKPSSETGADMYSGHYEKAQVADLDELDTILSGLKHNQAVSYGIAKVDKAPIRTKAKVAGTKGAIARSREYFGFPAGHGVFMVDYDPQDGDTPLTSEELYNTICNAMPELGDVEMLWRPSASSCIYHGEKELKGVSGQRLYCIVDDGSGIPELGKLLFKRLWLAGHGHIFISRTGTIFPRTPIDSSVYQPEKLDFAAGAKCVAPLERKSVDSVFFDGEPVFKMSTMVPLTAAEDAKYLQLVQAAKAEAQPEADSVRDKHIEASAIRQAGAGASEEALEKARKTQQAVHSGGLNQTVLPFDYKLHLDEHTTVTVREVNADKDEYSTKTFCDPLEPEYRGWQPNSKLKSDDGNTRIYSWAHGGREFPLQTKDASELFAHGEAATEELDEAAVETLSSLLRDRVLIEDGSRVGDLKATARNKFPITKLTDFKNARQFNVQVGDSDGKPVYKELGNAWAKSPELQVARAALFIPEVDGALVTRNGERYYNLYRPPSHKETNDAPQTFLDHIKHIVPDPGEANIVVDWLAFKVQNPAKRSYALMQVASSQHHEDGTSFGIGRTVLGEVIKQMFQSGVITITFDDLVGKSNFTGWKENCLVAIVSEAKDSNSGGHRSAIEAYETFKVSVDTTVGKGEKLNRKYGSDAPTDIFYNVLMFVNHADAMKIPGDDRRLCVVSNTATRRTNAEYAAIHNMVNDDAELAKVYWFLKRRDLSGFDANNPPMTAAKQLMIDMSLSVTEEAINLAIDSFKGDIITQQQLTERVNQFRGELGMSIFDSDYNHVPRHIRRKFLSLPKLDPGEKNGGRVRVEDIHGKTKQVGVRLLRNIDRWQGCDRTNQSTAELVRAEFEKNKLRNE